MEALEFSAKIEDGLIRLPKQFQEYQNAFVRIIILTENPVNHILSKKEKLKAIMLKMGEKNIFNKIPDAKEWQRTIRNEWD